MFVFCTLFQSQHGVQKLFFTGVSATKSQEVLEIGSMAIFRVTEKNVREVIEGESCHKLPDYQSQEENDPVPVPADPFPKLNLNTKPSRCSDVHLQGCGSGL